jgi:hypothetical protein
MKRITIGSNPESVGAQQQGLARTEIPQENIRTPVAVVGDKVPGPALEQHGGSSGGAWIRRWKRRGSGLERQSHCSNERLRAEPGSAQQPGHHLAAGTVHSKAELTLRSSGIETL